MAANKCHIERSQRWELGWDGEAPYRLCFDGTDTRFPLSAGDAIRSQKCGTPFVAVEYDAESLALMGEDTEAETPR